MSQLSGQGGTPRRWNGAAWSEGPVRPDARQGYQPVRIRAGDADRSAAVDILSEHYVDGRLDKDELDIRTNAALAAVYLDELDGLFADLPTRPAAPRPDAPRAHQDPGRMKPPRAAPRRGLLEPVMWPLLWIALAVMLVVVTRGMGLWVLFALWWFTSSARGSCWNRSRSRNR